MKKQKQLLFLLFFVQHLIAQQENFTIPDSLATASYENLNNGIAANWNDKARASVYAKSWLEKAKVEENKPQEVLAYKAVMHTIPNKIKLIYVDSLLSAAIATRNNNIIGAAYLTAGAAYYENKKQAEALDNYLQADKYLSNTDDVYLKHKIKYAIAGTKYYLGFYEEAIALYRQCINYFKEENDLAYLKSLHAISLCYNRTGKLKWSSQYNQIGLKTSRELGIETMVPYFTHAEGMTQFYNSNYKLAVELLSESMLHLEAKDDFSTKALAWFYIGKSNWKMGNQQKAVSYFKKVDKTITANEYAHPDLRENYELLINHYKNTRDLEKEFYYVNRLLKMDSLLNRDYKYLSGKIYKEYDTKQLLKEKDKLESRMKGNKVIYTAIIAALVVTVGILFYSRVRNRKRYRQKYEEFMKRKNAGKPSEAITLSNQELNINPDVVKMVVKNMEKFELRKKYLEKELGTVKMAAMLNTNTKYLSKIILHYRNKNFIQYLNHLRIEHIVELLKTQSKYRNYTNKALGEEAGFGSTQIFTQVFKAHTGTSPTFFIKQLSKEE